MPTLTRQNSLGKQLFVERMVEENVALVHHLVRKRLKYLDWRGADYEDAVQCGLMTLQRSATFFDRMRGVKFSSYAYRAILNELTRWEDSKNREKGYNNRSRSKYKRPLVVELETVGDDECLCDTNQEAVEEEERKRRVQDQYREVQKVIRTLDPRTQAIVVKYCYKGSTLRELGEEWGLSRERIRQIIEKGLEVLRIRTRKIAD